MNETDYLKAQMGAEERSEQATAIYHSHVDAGAYFSEMDQEFAEHELFPFPDVAHIVIAVWEGKVTQLGIWQRSGRDSGFIGRCLEVRRI